MALVDGQLWQLTLTIIHMEYQRVLSSLSQSHAAMESGKLSRASRLMTIAGKKFRILLKIFSMRGRKLNIF